MKKSLLGSLLAVCLLSACQMQQSADKTVSTSVTTTAGTTKATTVVVTIPEKKGVDLAAIQNGDYSSVAGTWQRADGTRFTFNDKGLIGDDTLLRPVSNENGILTVNVNSTQGAGGFILLIIEAGASVPAGYDNVADTSDKTQDRMWGGQTNSVADPTQFFYRVTE